MVFIRDNIKWVMLVSGILTSTMFYGVIAPQAALVSMFGDTFSGELQSIVIRSWSALVGLIGIVLIIGYLKEDLRKYSLVIAAVSKSIFVILILTYGQTFLGNVWPAITMDILVVTAALAYFILC